MTPSLRWGLTAGCFLAIFTLIATQVFVRWTGLIHHTCGGAPCFAFQPTYQWWLYLWDWCVNDPDPWIGRYLVRGGVAGAAIPAFFAMMHLIRQYNTRGDLPAWLPRPPQTQQQRARSDNYGDARWATAEELREAYPGPYGIVVGENYDPRLLSARFSPRRQRTWGPGGKAELLIHTLEEFSPHSLVIAGTRSGKTMSLIPTLAHTWRGPAFIFDPAVEITPMVRACREAMGHTVRLLSLETAATMGANVCEGAIGAIAAGSPTAETECLQIVEWVTGYTAKSDRTAEFFKDSGKSFIAALVLHVLWSPHIPPHLKNLRTVRALQSQSQVKKKKLLNRIAQFSASPKARMLAAELVYGEADETLTGIFLNAHHCTEWLTTEAYADLVSGDAFSFSDVVRGDTDIACCLPAKALQGNQAGIARCILGATINACYDADGATHPTVGFFLDDARFTGRIEILENARDDSAKFGAALHMLYQSPWQIDQQWGGEEGRLSWFDNCGFIAISGVGSVKFAEEMARYIGNRGLEARSSSRNINFGGVGFGSRGRSTTTSEIPGPLINAAQIIQTRRDARFLFAPGQWPACVGSPLWYRRREPWTRMVGVNRFYAGRTP